MEIYSLTQRGERLAHSYRAPDNPTWRVIFFLNRRGQATKEQIMENVSGVTSLTLIKLKSKGVIRDETEVNV